MILGCDRAAIYESGGQEFESLRARQYLAPGFRAKITHFYGFCKEHRCSGVTSIEDR
jgi:hypothetical protein